MSHLSQTATIDMDIKLHLNNMKKCHELEIGSASCFSFQNITCTRFYLHIEDQLLKLDKHGSYLLLMLNSTSKNKSTAMQSSPCRKTLPYHQKTCLAPTNKRPSKPIKHCLNR